MQDFFVRYSLPAFWILEPSPLIEYRHPVRICASGGRVLILRYRDRIVPVLSARRRPYRTNHHDRYLASC